VVAANNVLPAWELTAIPKSLARFEGHFEVGKERENGPGRERKRKERDRKMGENTPK